MYDIQKFYMAAKNIGPQEPAMQAGGESEPERLGQQERENSVSLPKFVGEEVYFGCNRHLHQIRLSSRSVHQRVIL